MADTIIPPPPAGFTVDQNIPPPPAGFKIDQPASALERMGFSALRGLFQGGPLGFAASAGLEGTKQLGKALDVTAYKAGGAVTDVLAGKVPPEVAGAAGYAANIATQAVPTIIGGFVGSKAAPVLEQGGRAMMQSTIKPTLATRASGQAPRAIETMLKKGIPATQGGMEAVSKRVGQLEETLTDILSKSSGTVSKATIEKSVGEAIKDVNLNLDRASNIKDIEKAAELFKNHEAIKQLGDIPVLLANQMKQAFYKELSGKAYLPGQAISAFDKGEKALARSLKTEIAKAEPAVIPSLAEQSELLNVLKVVGPRASLEGNKNIVGLGILSPTMERTMIWMMERYPWFKSMVARGMYSGSEVLATGTGAAAGAALGRQSGKENE